jgi:hypothetical protein
MKPAGAKTPVYGDWNPNLVRSSPEYSKQFITHNLFKIFVVWTLAGICYGMVELIRRVM